MAPPTEEARLSQIIDDRRVKSATPSMDNAPPSSSARLSMNQLSTTSNWVVAFAWIAPPSSTVYPPTNRLLRTWTEFASKA